ncbi:cell division protein [Altererythrobacter sp. H2]|uniref:cell division protein FtsX n=1 Tax=Altererythrobacter sp. H2 TaxID=3108391 RepID=UPI000BDC9273|nr:cell division protein [Altererythrobacter sp. H2]OZA93705.1 MAG: cell division protein [Erythrobacter sp. 34-65-8]WRK96560.1 cell division protein [Altererythrobacter sp. H2]
MSEARPPAIGRTVARGFSPFAGERAAQLVPHSRLAGPMPWVIAIMVALTVIAAAGGLALSNLAREARAELSGGVTVQIVEAVPQERERQAAAAEQILAEHPAVGGLKRVSDAELDRLLEPWLGVGEELETVPIPALIDVRLVGDADRATLTELQQSLLAQAPGARVDAQAGWLGPVFSAIASLQWLALALVILLAATSSAAVWLAARSALGANRETIEIVHLLGGTDSQIARIFQRAVGFDATLGGTVGLALGLAGVLVLGQQFAALGAGLMGGAGLTWLDWILLALVPVAAVAIAMLTARMTVLSALRTML